MKNAIATFLTIRSLKIFFIFFSCHSVFAQATPQTFWWNDAVFYEVFVRSFKDSDGDGKGDFKGLISKLDYLNDGNPNTTSDLGITAIWLMPIMESPSYHGYDVSDYRTIEQDYGSNDDFKNFMTAAHARGIKVIVDYVMNHTSSQHPWFQASSDALSVKRDWYVWQNPAPNIKGPWNQTVWYPKNNSNYYAIFWSEMPDLNYNSTAVKDEMFDVARFWMEDMHVDGFRLDAVKYIFESGNTLEDVPQTLAFWKEFRSFYKSVNANAFAVGEAWTSTQKVAPYVNDNGLDFCFEFDLAAAIVSAANSGSASALNAQVNKAMAAYPFSQFGTFLTNHDMNRVMTQLGSSTAKAKVAADILLTLPGIPYLYYGEEIGMTGSGADENKRTPLQWDNTAQAGFSAGNSWRAVNADYTSKNIAAQQADATSLWNKYRKLIGIRNNQVALRRGTFQSVGASSTAVFSFLRQYENENILVVSNTGSAALSNVLLNISNAGISSESTKMLDLLSGAEVPLTVNVSGGFDNLSIAQIPANSTMIFKLANAAGTGIEKATQHNYQVYPVPSSNGVFIEIENTFTGVVSCRVVDLLGAEKQLSTFDFADNEKQFLSCSGLESGVYFLTLESKGISTVFKIVIQ